MPRVGGRSVKEGINGGKKKDICKTLKNKYIFSEKEANAFTFCLIKFKLRLPGYL